MDKVSFEKENVRQTQRSPNKEITENMLRLSPNDFLTFSKGEGLENTVEITCTSKIPVTYKIQTTSPEKFRVRPRCGVLNPGERVSIAILYKDNLTETTKDKFLVMCLPVPQGAELTAQKMSEVWKHKQFNSFEVEQHRLTCVYKNIEKSRNGYFTGEKGPVSKSSEGTSVGVSDLTKHANKLEKQLKFTQFLQCVTLVFLLILSVAVVYLLKLHSASPLQEDLDAESNVLGTTSCQTDTRI